MTTVILPSRQKITNLTINIFGKGESKVMIARNSRVNGSALTDEGRNKAK